MMQTQRAPLALARLVRVSSASVAVGILAGLGALSPVTTSSPDGLLPQAPTASSSVARALDEAVDVQVSQGRTCHVQPRLTDAVLYEFTGSHRITVLTFDQALRETAAQSGWVRAYCV